MRRLKSFTYPAVLALLLAYFFLFTDGDSRRPSASEFERTVSHAVAATEITALGKAHLAAIAAHPGLSGFHLITHGNDALMMRLGIIQAAQRSLDLQYYSFQNDKTGKLLLEALLHAADRGVRVRILVDDITMKKSDEVWSLLNAHPNVELRLFNPFATLDQSFLSRIDHFYNDFRHFTKRMHNKSFIADNQLAIIGGRNLGDAYFDNNQDFNFRDIDILAVGPVTQQVSHVFDTFWNGKEAYPFSALQLEKNDAGTLAQLRKELQDHWQELAKTNELSALPPLVLQLKNGQLPFTWADAELAADMPGKIEKPRDMVTSKPVDQIEQLVAGAKSEFIVVSPYFVPGDDGMEWFEQLIKRGIRVQVLTNSLASTDVVAVHAGYRRYRKAVITAGINLYEMKPIPGKHPRTGRFASASRVSLHTKIYIVDRRDVAIGTMNLDPRSIELNTEIALVIHSPELAEQLAAMFDHATAPSSSYHVTLEDSHLQWTEEQDGVKKIFTHEPKAGFWRSVEVNLYALLPFENQL